MLRYRSCLLFAVLGASPLLAQGHKLNEPFPRRSIGLVDAFLLPNGGGRAFFTARRSTGFGEPADLYRAPLNGSASPVFVDEWCTQLSQAPDGSRIVYQARLADGVHLRSVSSSGASTSVTLHGPFADPDGPQSFVIGAGSDWVVYQAGQHRPTVPELYSVPIDGSAPSRRINTPLPSGRGISLYRLSPDGTRVAFIADFSAQGVDELFSVPIDGSSGQVRINGPLVNQAVVRNFLITDDGSSVVYTQSRPFVPRDLYVVPMTGGAAAKKLNGSWPVLSLEALSPDGQFVLFKTEHSIDLYSASLAKGDPVKLNGPLALEGQVFGLRIGSDSQRVVYIADEDALEVRELFSAPIDGSSPAVQLNGQLFDANSDVYGFVVTPDAARVVYEARQDTSVAELYSAPIDGSSPAIKLTSLVPTGLADIGQYEVSPDSQWVVFQARDLDDAFELFAVPIDRHLEPARLSDPLEPDWSVRAFALHSSGEAVLYEHSLTPLAPSIEAEPIDELRMVRLPRTEDPVLVNEIWVSAIGDVSGYGVVPGGERVVYIADQEVDDVNELFSVGLGDGRGRAKLSTAMVAGGDVVDLAIGGDRVTFIADADADEAFELYGVSATGDAGPVELSGELAPGVDVRSQWITPAGTRVVYQADAHVFGDLFSVPTDGSSPPIRLNPPLVAGGHVVFLGLTPDATRVLYLADQTVNGAHALYSAEVAGGSASIPLSSTFADTEVLALVTEDSAWAVYRVGQFEGALWSARLDGSELHELDPDVRDVATAPDSLRVVYTRFDASAGAYRFYAVPVDGSAAPLLLTPDERNSSGAHSTLATVSADSARVVYVGRTAGDTSYQLYSVPIDGSQPAVRLSLPQTILPRVQAFVITPDASHVVYRSDDGVNTVGELYAVPIDGSAPPVRLSTAGTPASDVHAGIRLTSDGQRAVFLGDLRVSGVPELFSAPLDGSQPQRVENGPIVAGGRVLDFELTKDGAVVYRARQDDPEASELYLGYVLPRSKRTRAEVPAGTVPVVR